MNADHDYDAELSRLNEVLRRACGIRSRDHVLDIGCGTGHTTREAARTAQLGNAFGVDISASAIARARELAQEQRLCNVVFECANAEVYPFPHERFDVAISRFGTMFFPDPTAAFANIRQSLRPDGRLVMMVWQSGERNEWDVALRQALGEPGRPAPTTASGPDPFSLADPPTVRAILENAGFADVAFTDVREPVYYGPDLVTALEWVSSFTCTNHALAQLDPDAAARAVVRLRETLVGHHRHDGVWFDSRAWIVTARRP
jgi:SAM-dependent methyltransferase